MEGIGAFQRVVDDPHGYLKSLKAGKSILGYCCSYTPEEIIHAAGIHPVRLFGSKEESNLSDKHLQSYCCSLVRNVLSEALSGRLDYLDGAVFPHTCDTIQRLSDIWRLNTSFRFFSDIVLPVKLTTESAREYFEAVLRKFKSELEIGFSMTVTDDALHASIRTYNAIRTSLKDIYELHEKNPRLIPGSALNACVTASMILDRDEAAALLKSLADGLKTQTVAPDPSRKRIMLAGSVCSQPDVYSLIERSGADVVWDDLCTGSRYFEGMVSEEGDPMEAIAERYYSRIICPAKHSSVTARGNNLVKSAIDHKIDGVIFLMLKFCDPHAFDYPYLKAFLDRENIPGMLLEIEGQLPPEGQLLTRFETFVEML